jgi:predicted AAA+ superfamily ATPase
LGTPRFGRLFEQFVINELYRANDYNALDYAFSFYSTGSAEVDLVLSRGRLEAPKSIEIKSSPIVYREDLAGLELFSNEYPDAELYCISTNPKGYGVTLLSGREVQVVPFQESGARILGGGIEIL